MNKIFKDLNYSSIVKRLLLLLIPVIIMPLGVSCYYACGLGADPYSIFVDGEHALLNLTYGQITLMNNSIILVVMIIFGRKYLNIGTVITAFTSGALIDFFLDLLLLHVSTPDATLLVNSIVLISGAILFAVGVGLYVAIELGVGAVDFIGLFIVDKTSFQLKYVRIALDAMFVVVGYFIGGTIGVGTVVGVLCTGPIISYTIKLVKNPIEKFAGPKRNLQASEEAQENAVCE